MPIFDQGYQHWNGALSGHAWRWLAIAKEGLRGQLKSWNVRIALIAAWVPAVALVLAMVLWGLLEQGSQNVVDIVRPLLPPGVAADPHAYREAVWSIAYSIFFRVEIFFIMVLMVVAGPNLISRDLRFNALPLYFSRPLRRFDYFLGKLGVLAVMVAAVAIAPAVVAYVLGVCFSLDLGIIRDTWRLLPASILYGLVIVVSAGTLMLAMSSLSRRSLYVGIAWGGFWVVSSSVAGVLDGIHRDTIGGPMYQEETAKAQAGQRANYNRVNERVEEALAKAAPTDWRPLCSYTANLHRLGEALFEHGRRLGPDWQGHESAAERNPEVLRPARRGVERGRGPPARRSDDAAVSVDLVGRRSGGPFGDFDMHIEHAREIAGPAAVTPVVEFDGVSKWYGNVIGLNKLTLRIHAGVTGLLGPNGAGKSTLLQLATGQLRPSQGSVRVLGSRVANHPSLMRYVGLCPEQDAFYEWMTGRDFVRTCALLTGMGRRQATAAAEKALALVGMTEHMRRPIRGYSKGMRQRTKLAQALVHEPRVLFLDEPFTGTDPVARRDLQDVIRGLGKAGHSVVVSSHVLHEVEALTPNVILLHRGRLVAEGQVHQIRDLIDQHPHRIILVCDDCRSLAAKMVRWEDVDGVKMLPGDQSVLVETRRPDAFYARLPALSLENVAPLREVYSEDNNLEAVFKYLVSP